MDAFTILSRNSHGLWFGCWKSAPCFDLSWSLSRPCNTHSSCLSSFTSLSRYQSGTPFPLSLGCYMKGTSDVLGGLLGRPTGATLDATPYTPIHQEEARSVIVPIP